MGQKEKLTDALISRVLALPGIEERKSLFGDHPAWRVHGKEIMHFDKPDLVDVRLTRRVIRDRRQALASNPRVHFRQNQSDWVRIRLASPEDIAFILEMVQLASDAHRLQQQHQGRVVRAHSKAAARPITDRIDRLRGRYT